MTVCHEGPSKLLIELILATPIQPYTSIIMKKQEQFQKTVLSKGGIIDTETTEI